MEKIYCLNLCDCIECIDSFSLNEVEGFERIYIGSYFCSRYFLDLQKEEINKVMQLFNQETIRFTLVIPIITEKNWTQMIAQVQNLLNCYEDKIDEITVNDYGTLSYFSENCNRKINMGRLFAKDYRDPRYVDYYELIYKPRFISKVFQHILNKFLVNGIELDPTHLNLDLEELRCLAQKITISIHTPWCYQTVGQICEYSSILKPLDKKFRANDRCQKECNEINTEYKDDERHQWIRLGKAIYFKNENVRVIGLDKFRWIEWPIEKIRKECVNDADTCTIE